MSRSSILLVVAAAFATSVHAQSSASAAAAAAASLAATLFEAPTAVDRQAAVPNDYQFIFDFLNPTGGVVTGAGGHTVEASAANFPVLVDNNIAMTIGFLGPCAINTPHTHPRATEINFSVNGTLRGGFLAENGAKFIEVTLNPGEAAIFPQAAIHFEMNTGCEPAMFIAGFNSPDPGVLQVAQRFFDLPVDILSSTLNDLGVEEVLGLEALIPDNVIAGTDECLRNCGLTRPSAQPTAQHQPRVSGNAIPSGVTPAALMVATPSPPSAKFKL